MLLHDVVGQTAEMFPNFLRALCEGGYRVVSLTPGRESPALASAPRGWRSFTDRLAGQPEAVRAATERAIAVAGIALCEASSLEWCGQEDSNLHWSPN